MRRFVRTIVVFIAVAMAPSWALAQTASTLAQAASQAGGPPPRVAGGPDGFAIESGDGDYRLQIGLLVHADGRFALHDENNQVTDTFAIRRLRPYLRGRLGRRFEFHLNPDVAGGSLVVQDAYLDTVFSPAFRVRIGKGKTPFGFERLHPASNLLFMERALPTAVAPNRDVGVQVLGDISGVVSYLAGVMNGVADGASGDVDASDGKDLAGRVVVRPFNRLAASSPARGLAIAIAGSRGAATGAGALPAFRTQTIQQPYFSYVTGSEAAVGGGIRTRVSPSVSYYHGRFGGWAEYARSTTPVTRGADAADIQHRAWQLAASWVITGEHATDAGSGVRPRADFDFGNGTWGAFQVAARVHALAIDADAVSRGFAAPGASPNAEAWTLGLNWYATANVRYTLNVERTVFDGSPGSLRRTEHALALRTQLSL